MTGILQALLASVKAAVSSVTDEYFEYVSLLLPGNGTNGAQNNTFLDSSTNNYTITRNGNPTQGTFSPYGDNWSNYFDGTGDYLSIADNAALEFGSGDFTLECFIFAEGSQVGDARIFHKALTSTTGYTFIFQTPTQLRFVAGTASVNIDITTTADFVSNQWNHVAVTRNGTNLNIWINGVSRASGTSSSTIGDNAGATTIGGDGSTNCKGYISSARIVKGTAVYTAAFTPPTAPLTAITNTSLLTCQSNRFIDNSSNAFAITRNGDVSVQRFSPFSPTAAYSASTIGGSGYFDGTLDYLYASGANLVVGTGTFTLEWWVYLPKSPIDWNGTVNIGDGSFPTSGRITPLIAAGAAYLRTSLNTSFTDFYFNDAPLRVGQWNHMAIQRETSGTVLAYCNGKVATSGSLSGSGVNFTIDEVTVGNSNQGYLTGFISNVRLTRGSALYGSTYTVPTAPVTGGSLLLNFTNAGIIDNAMMNDLETIGNAQISTSVSKFGGSSMYFDGTGDSANTLASPNLSFGSGNFTVEFWMYTSDAAADLISQRPSGNFGPFGIYIGSSQTIEGYVSTTGSSWVFTGSRSFTNNQWTHVALVRDGSTVYLYVDGTRSTGGNVSTNSLMADTTNPLRIGGNVGNGDFNGYIDDLRITKGIARYTANFTAPTSAFPTS